MKKSSAQPATPTQTTNAQVIPAPKPQAPPLMIEPIVASGSTETAGTPAATDSAAQQKAFEDAVKAQLAAEMMKLQNQFEADLKKSQPKNAPVAVAPPVSVPAPLQPQEEEQPAVSAAQLDQQRREAQAQAAANTQTTAPVPAPAQTQTTAPTPQPAQPQPQVANTQTAAPAPVPAVREGDVVSVTALDTVPKAIRQITPAYPTMARSQKLAATIILSAFVNENGQVTDVRVLRGEPRFGMTDAAVRALRSTRFTPAIKDGKKVKTWLPQQYEFKP
jgi:TonB family protein